MSIQVTCVQCGTSHQVNNRLAGRRVRCPNCDTAVHVPELDADQPVPSEPEPDLVEPVEIAAEPGTPVLATEPPAPLATTVTPAAAELDDDDDAIAPDDDDEAVDEVLPRSNRPEEEMDMTPMVDVTFLLLIFFMVTAAFSLQKSIEMPRQQTDLPSTSVVEDDKDELDIVELQVDEYGGFLVMAPEWERETPGKQNLITALKEAIAGAAAGMKLKIQVHELAKLESLVDAMDAGTIAGFAELEVTQVEEF